MYCFCRFIFREKSINQQGSVVEVDLKFSSVKDFETFKCKLKSGREESQDMQLSFCKSTVLLLTLTFDLTVDLAKRKNISLLEYEKEKHCFKVKLDFITLLG